MKTQSFRHSESLSIKVANYLRRSIVQGEFGPGERLNELLISTRLSISRSPVREAFRILESENLVDIHSRRGAFVKRLSYKEVEEIFTVVSMIETTAVRLAVSNMNANRQKELKSIIEQLEDFLKGNDVGKYMNISMRLHHFIMKASENSLLIRIYNYLEPQRERLRRIIRVDKNNIGYGSGENHGRERAGRVVFLKDDFKKEGGEDKTEGKSGNCHRCWAGYRKRHCTRPKISAITIINHS